MKYTELLTRMKPPKLSFSPRPNYCNALLGGFLQVLLVEVKESSNAQLAKFAHITPLLYDLHWLPISSRIQEKNYLR